MIGAWSQGVTSYGITSLVSDACHYGGSERRGSLMWCRGAGGKPQGTFQGTGNIFRATADRGPERASHLSKSHSISEISQLADHVFLNHVRQMGREGVLTLAHRASLPCSLSKP